MKSMPLRSNELRSNELRSNELRSNELHNKTSAAFDQSYVLVLFGACCLFLSAIEYMIPKPLPFMRIGLANLPLMLALNILPLPAYIVLICIKITGQALITGTLFSYVFLFSAAGTFCSALLMYALKRVFKKYISFIGIGTAGAMVSCKAQILLAYFFIFKESVMYIAPVFLLTGLVTGIILGVFCETYVRKSKYFPAEIKNRRFAGYREEDGEIPRRLTTCSASNQTHYADSALNKNKFINSNALFITGLLLMFFIVFNPSTEFRAAAFLILWLLAVIFRKKTNPVLTITFITAIVVFNLIIPYGKVLFSIGFLKITSGSLRAGIHRAATFQALIMLSKLTIRDDLKLPGKFGNLLGESLRIFSLMINKKPVFKGKNIIEVIDDLLFCRL